MTLPNVKVVAELMIIPQTKRKNYG